MIRSLAILIIVLMPVGPVIAGFEIVPPLSQPSQQPESSAQVTTTFRNVEETLRERKQIRELSRSENPHDRAYAAILKRRCLGGSNQQYYRCVGQGAIDGYAAVGWFDMNAVFLFAAEIEVIGERIDRGEITEAHGNLLFQEAANKRIYEPAQRMALEAQQMQQQQEAQQAYFRQQQALIEQQQSFQRQQNAAAALMSLGQMLNSWNQPAPTVNLRTNCTSHNYGGMTRTTCR